MVTAATASSAPDQARADALAAAVERHADAHVADRFAALRGIAARAAVVVGSASDALCGLPTGATMSMKRRVVERQAALVEPARLSIACTAPSAAAKSPASDASTKRVASGRPVLSTTPT